jgi:hypothetical protein
MHFLLLGAAMAIGQSALAASGDPEPPPRPLPVTIKHPLVPKGATMVGTATHATILRVPPSPTSDVKPRLQNYRTVSEWYAQEEGLSLEEARKRLSEQQAISPIFQRLQERLRASEPDNYVDARLVHQPDLGYVLYFKRDPAATLRKYSVNPRFGAAAAPYTRTELQAMIDTWTKRFGEAGIVGGFSISPTEGRAEMMMLVTEAEYRRVAKARGWGAVPSAIRLGFAGELPFPRVDPRYALLLRGFASERQPTIRQREAGRSGRVILDDGCLRLAAKGKSKGPLVVFHRETGIGVDEQGYLAAIDRRTGKAKGRIGEMWSWAGPNPDTEFDGLDELKTACGEGPIVNVGNPESQARFRARNPGY